MIWLVIYGSIIGPIGILLIGEMQSLKIFRLIIIRKFFHYWFVLFFGPCFLYPYLGSLFLVLSIAIYFWFEIHRLYYKNFAAI